MKSESAKIFENILTSFASTPGMEIPPPVYKVMDAEAIDYVEKQSLTIRFPMKKEYQNPLGHMQGGVICAAIDNTLGPLSYLVAPPSVTTQLNTQYVRPVLPTDKFIDITAMVVDQTKSQIIMRAEVRNEKNKLVAICQATQQIISR